MKKLVFLGLLVSLESFACVFGDFSQKGKFEVGVKIEDQLFMDVVVLDCLKKDYESNGQIEADFFIEGNDTSQGRLNGRYSESVWAGVGSVRLSGIIIERESSFKIHLVIKKNIDSNYTVLGTVLDSNSKQIGEFVSIRKLDEE